MNESKYQSQMVAATTAAFPWLRPEDYDVEHVFKVRLGRSTYEVNAEKDYTATGRADIILSRQGRRLAVLELKRPGATLSANDGDQGLSYARLLNPMPPLVIVAAGPELRFLDTYSGQTWPPHDNIVTEVELGRRLAATAAVAAEDRAQAIETLLGPDSAAWSALVTDASDRSLGEQTGDWGDSLLPFVDGFLIPRAATQGVLDAFGQGERLVFVTGEPLAGKSNVLRELVDVSRAGAERAVLYVEGDGYDEGLYQRIATLLEAQLGWPADRDAVRRWLRQLSQTSGKSLVIAVDGLPRDRARLLAEISELTSAPFGPGLRIVLAIDPDEVAALQRSDTGRKASHLGRASRVVVVGPLSDDEAQQAGELLYDLRVGLLPGYRLCRQYRTPWVLRALMAAITAHPKYQQQNLMTVAPAVLGLPFFDFARTRYRGDPELRAGYRAVARALIRDLKGKRSFDLILEGLTVFAIRRKTLREKVDAEDIQALKRCGALREAVVENERVFVARLPELMTSELAFALGAALAKKMEDDPAAAADWLIARTSLLPMGDLIGARAILDATVSAQDLPLDLIEALLSARPRTETLGAGHTMLTRLPGAPTLKLEILNGGKLRIQGNGHDETVEGDDETTTYADTESWSILAHLAAVRMGLFQNGAMVQRADPVILGEVGSAAIPLYKPPHDLLPQGVMMHDTADGAIVCHQNGIIEPITQSIYHFLERDDEEREPWIETAAASGRAPLIVRVATALNQLSTLEPHAIGVWAREQLDAVVMPALRASPAGEGAA